jgi:hypothetical protein
MQGWKAEKSKSSSTKDKKKKKEKTPGATDGTDGAEGPKEKKKKKKKKEHTPASSPIESPRQVSISLLSRFGAQPPNTVCELPLPVSFAVAARASWFSFASRLI